MNAILESILDYIGKSALLTLQQIAIVLGPSLALAFILDHLSQFVRVRAARLLGRNVYIYLTAPGVMIPRVGPRVSSA